MPGPDTETVSFATLLAPAVALGASLVCAPIAREVLEARGVVDQPNARSSHAVPTVRGGGVAFVVVALTVIAWVAVRVRDFDWLAILAATSLLAAVSFVDDVRPLGARARLAVHLVCASLLVYLVRRSPPEGSAGVGAVLWLVTLVGAVGHTNAFNFMDGIDGLASLQAILAALGTAAILIVDGASPSSVTVIACGVIGAAVLGFLPSNFPRARMFMGDVGSAALGFLLAALVVRGVLERGLDLLLALALPHLGFVLDAAITFGRRVARGERVTEPHREHFYQRLVRSGLAHPPVSGLYAVGTTLSVIAGCVAARLPGWPAALSAAGATLYWLLLFAFAERRFARASR